MKPKAEIFDTIYQDYLSQIAKLNSDAVARRLDLKQEENDAILIPFFGTLYRVSPAGVIKAEGKEAGHLIHHMLSVILCKYLILCPEHFPDEGRWASYKDFKDAAPFVGGFFNTVERPIAEYFSGKLGKLEKICQQIGGHAPDTKLSYELAVQFEALPKIPVLMLFNDADADFPAQCKVLFKESVQQYLDVECIAMIGMFFADLLKRIESKTEKK